MVNALMSYVTEEEYTKFKHQVLGDVALGSLSCDELAERIGRWQDAHGPTYEAGEEATVSERINKMKQRIKRQHKTEAKRWIREQRGDAPFPVRTEEVDTPLSGACKESSPPDEGAETVGGFIHGPIWPLPELFTEAELRDSYCAGLFTGMIYAIACIGFGFLLARLML